MSDRRIVERLREWPLSEKLALEAAARIEALEAALRWISAKTDDRLAAEFACAALAEVPSGMHKFTDANGPDE